MGGQGTNVASIASRSAELARWLEDLFESLTVHRINPVTRIHRDVCVLAETAAGAQVDTTTMTVRPILILSPFFSRWALKMRRPLSQVPLVELRSSTYQ